jgi:hypothetical protein
MIQATVTETGCGIDLLLEWRQMALNYSAVLLHDTQKFEWKYQIGLVFSMADGLSNGFRG